MTTLALDIKLQQETARSPGEVLAHGSVVGLTLLGGWVGQTILHTETAQATPADSYPSHTISVSGTGVETTYPTINDSAVKFMEFVAGEDPPAAQSVDLAVLGGNSRLLDHFAAFVTGVSGDKALSGAYNAAALTAPSESNVVELPAVPSPEAKIATPMPMPAVPTTEAQNIAVGAEGPSPGTTSAPAPTASAAEAVPSPLWTPPPPPTTKAPALIVPKIEAPSMSLWVPAPPQIETPVLKTVLIPTNNNIAAVQSIDGKPAEQIQAELKYNETKWGILPGWVSADEGNYFGESGDRTGAVGDNKTAFGLFQARGSRAIGLPSDWYGQDDFAMADIQREYPRLWNDMHTIPNPTDAQIQNDFSHWERYAVAGSRYTIGKLIQSQMDTPIQAQVNVIVSHNLDGSEHYEKAA